MSQKCTQPTQLFSPSGKYFENKKVTVTWNERAPLWIVCLTFLKGSEHCYTCGDLYSKFAWQRNYKKHLFESFGIDKILSLHTVQWVIEKQRELGLLWRLDYHCLDYFELQGHLEYPRLDYYDKFSDSLFIYFELRRSFWAIWCQFIYSFRSA